MYIYADDSTHVVAGHNVMERAWPLEEDLQNINKWAANNRMALNAETTRKILICSKPKHRSLAKNKESLKVTFQDQVTETVSSTKLLGIYLDSNLTWNEHVEKTRKKICNRLGLLKCLKRFLT